MAKLTKQDVVNSVSDSSGLDKKSSAAALDAVIQTLSDALANGDSIGLIGFGTFEVKERAAREGRNPQTGAKIKISKKSEPTFRAGKQLKDAVN